jgi:hypothetical protein
LDPSNHKTVVDLQEEAAEAAKITKGKEKHTDDVGENDGEEDRMDVDNEQIVPLPTSGGIQHLREKLHAKIASFRRGGGLRDDADSKDELLEERRRQRAALREHRRKETKEKIRKKEEEKGKAGKAKGRDGTKPTSANVGLTQAPISRDLHLHGIYPVATPRRGSLCFQLSVNMCQKRHFTCTRIRQRHVQYPLEWTILFPYRSPIQKAQGGV